MIRVGILGAGTVASFQVPGLSRLPGVEIAGCYDPERDRAEKLTARFGGRVFPSEEDLIADRSLTAVMVLSPTPCHHRQVLRSLEAGHHVFCEKPIAGSLREANEMVAAAEKSDRVFMVGMVLRFFHEFACAHDLVVGGELGEVGIVRTTRAAGFPRGWKDWYADPAQSGGVVVDMVAHDFDFLRWTLGPVERVFARSAPAEAGELFDYVLILLRFANGVLGHVEASWGHPPGTFFTRLEIAGTKGLLSFDSRQAVPLRRVKRGESDTAAGVAIPESPVAESPYQREMAHFLQLVRGEVEPRVVPQDAVEALRISLAARRSAATGRVVRPAEVT